MADGFNTLEDAAAAARFVLVRKEEADSNEFIGLLFQDPDTGKFKFTDLHNQGKEAKAKGRFRIPKGSLRGIIHNHAAGFKTIDDLKNLSNDDVHLARKLNVPSFISTSDGLFVFNPENGRTRGRVGRRQGITEEVLARIPIELIRNRSPAGTMQ